MAAVISGEGLGVYNSSLSTLGSRGPAANASLGRFGNQVYVNAYTGNLVLSERDEFVASLGLDLALTRTYNSLGQFDGDNNDNWRLGVHRKLTSINAGVSITKVYGDGSEIVFNYDSGLGYYLSTKGDGAHDTIKSESGNWVWHDGSSDVTETYNSAGQLLNIKDSDGNTKAFSYTGNLVTGISDSNGQTITLTYSGNNLQSITTVLRDVATGAVLRQETRVVYGYDASNRLTSVTVDLTPENTGDTQTFITRYTYDGTSKRIATIDSTGGGVPDLSIVYDGSGRVQTLTDGSGNITRYTYGATSTTVTDPLLRESVYHYDTANGRLTRVESPPLTTGGTRLVTEYAYDTAGNVTQVKDGAGAIVAFQYDSRGNLTRQTDAAGNVVAYTYTTDNLLVTETVYLVADPDYSGMGTITNGAGQAADPQTTYYVYDAEKHLRFVITPEGRVTEHRYFTEGTLGNTLRYTANNYSIAPLQAVPTLTAMTTWAAAANLTALERTDYQYDFRGQLSRVSNFSATDASGAGLTSGVSRSYFIYDQRGQLLKSVTPRGNAPAETALTAPSAVQHNVNNHETLYVYDGMGRLISRRDAFGALTSIAYDDINNRVSTTQANGLVTTDVYNNIGRLIASTSYEASQPTADRTAYSLYDAAGQLRVSIDAAGAATYYFYDGAGRQVAAIDPEGLLTEFVYDGAGRLLRKLGYATRVSQALLDQLAIDPAVLEQISALSQGQTLTASGSFTAVNGNTGNTQTAAFTSGSTSQNTSLTVTSAYQPSSVINQAWTLSGGQLVQTAGISLAPGSALFNDTSPTEVKATIYRSDGSLHSTVYTQVGATETQEIILSRPPVQPYGYQATATNDTVTPASQNANITVDSTQQYTTYTQTSNVQNFGYTYSSSSQSISGNGGGYSLVADSAARNDNTVTSVRADVYRSDGTFVHTVTLVPGHTGVHWIHYGAYGQGNITYLRWFAASNWNGQVNIGSLGTGNYYAVITTTDNAYNANTTSAPGYDGDLTWTRTNTVNFTIGGQIPERVTTRLSWPESVTPAGTTSISFRYKLTSSGTWTTKTVSTGSSIRYVDIDPAVNGTYHYEIIYRDTYGNVLKSTNTSTPPTFTLSGATDSTSTASFSYSTYSAPATTGSSIPSFAMTAAEAQTIARIEAKVFQAGTGTQVGSTATTYPAAHANYFAVSGQYYVNLRTGSVLPNGRYDVQIIKYYKNGTSPQTVTHTLEVGTQYEPSNQNKFWNAADNWNGQVNLQTGSGLMPFDTYRIDIAVRDDAPNYGTQYGTQVGSASAPGADGDGTWTRTNTIYSVVGGRTTFQWSNAGQPAGSVTEFAYRLNGSTTFTVAPVSLSGGQYTVTLDYLPPGNHEYRIRYLSRDDAALTVLPSLTLDQLRPQTGAADREVINVYDNAGRLAQTTLSSEAATVSSYDGASRLTRSEQAGAITRYFYDKDGRLAGTLDAERYFSEHVYDSAGRLIQTVRYSEQLSAARQAGGTFAQIKGDLQDGVQDAATLKSCYYYDAQGRMVGRVNEQGFLQETVYDARHAYREEKQYLTVVTVAANDTLATLKSRAGTAETTRHEFDSLGRQIARIAADGTITNYQYDQAGRLIQTIEAAGTADARITRTRYNVFGDVTGTVTVDSADIANNAWVLDANGNLVQTTGISLAPGAAVFNDTTPTEVKATIYRSDGTLYDTVYTQVGSTSNQQIVLNTKAPAQPYGYQPTATYDVVTTLTQTATMTVDSTQQYAPLTTSANVANYSWTYSSSTQSIASNGGGYSLVADSAVRNDNTPTSVRADVYRSDGTFVQTVTMVPGHTGVDWVHQQAYGGGDITYLRWNGATNWNGQVNLGALAAGQYYAVITTSDAASSGDTTLEPGDDGDSMWTRTNTVDFTIGGGSFPDHIDTRLSWPESVTPAGTSSITFRFKPASSGAWTTKTVSTGSSIRYVDFDRIANGSYNYEIVYKDSYGNTLKSTAATFTVNGANDSTPSAVFEYTSYYQDNAYPSGEPVTSPLAVDAIQQYAPISNSSNVANYGWTYSSSTQSIVNNGSGYSLVAGSAARNDNSVTGVTAKIFKADGTYVHTIGMSPGHTDVHWVHVNPYGSGDITYLRWNGATNWNGEVNVGVLEAGYYYAEITTTDAAYNANTTSAPGYDGDITWTRTNTVNFAIAGMAPDHVDTRLSWAESMTPANTASVSFRYKPAGPNAWSSATVNTGSSTRYVDIDRPANGSYDYEIVYKDGQGTTLKKGAGTFTVDGTNDSVLMASFQEYAPLVGSSIPAFAMTATEAQTIARIEAKVFLIGTGTQVGTTAVTYPAAHSNYFAVNGQYYVNLSVGSVLADGRYDVQIVKHYKSGTSTTVTHQLEVGLQPELNQRYFWNAADNWNGQVNLKIGSGSMPADTYRIVVSVRDDATVYGDKDGTTVGGPAIPGADGDGIWQQTATIYATLGGSVTAPVWNTAIDQQGVRYEIDGAGRRISELHPDGQKTLLYYDRNGRLVYSVNALGEVKAVVYNAFGEVERTTTYSGRISVTGLTGGADIATVAARLAAIANSAADNAVSFAYTGAGRLAATTDAESNTTTYGYNTRGELVDEYSSISAGVTVNTRYERDLLGRATAVIHDNGGIAARTQTAYDGFGRIGQARDARGKYTSYTYADNGRTVTITDPSGRTGKTEYDAYGRVLKSYDGLNQVTAYVYDTANRRVTVTMPDGVTASTWRTRAGEILKVQDGNGGITEYTYTAGKLATVKDAQGLIVTRNIYDNSGRLHETVDANGTVIRYTYDAADRIIRRAVDPSGLNLRTAYQFDGQGRQILVTEAEGTAAAVGTQYIYDREGRVKQMIVDPAGLKLSTRFSYDGIGNTLKVEQGTVASPAQQVTQYTYDKLGRKIKEQRDPAGLNITTEYKYDENGNLTRTIHPNVQSTWFGYDDSGRLLREIDALGGVTRHYYDGNGRLTETVRFFNPVGTGSLGDTASTGPGAVNPAAHANDERTLYVYDRNNRVRYTLEKADASNWQVSERLYDGNGNVIEIRGFDQYLANSSVTSLTADGSITESEFAALAYAGNIGNAARAIQVYDASNRARYTLTAVDAGNWMVTENLYDNRGNVIETRHYDKHLGASSLSTMSGAGSAGGARVTESEVASALVALGYTGGSFGNTQRSYFAYDAGNRLRFTVNALGEITESVYDAMGNIIAQTLFASAPNLYGLYSEANIGSKLNRAHSANQTTQYVYDKAGRLKQSIDALGISEHFEYDAMGNKTAYTNKNGAVWNYIYDSVSRLKAEISPAVNVIYGANTSALSRRLRTEIAYDALGNVTSRTDGIIQLNADGSSVDSSAVRITTYGYDAMGRQNRTTMPGWYDPATGKVEKNSGTGRFQLTSEVLYDALGNTVGNKMRVANNGNSGDYIYQYKTYDALGRVVHEIDALGNVTTNVYEGSNLKSIRRSANALTAPVPASQYWTSAGVEQNLTPSTSDRTINFKYDRAGRKTETYQQQVGGNYASSALAGSNPVSVTAYDASATTRYYYNALGQLTAEETKVNQDDWARTYHFYDKLDRETATVDALGYVTRHAYDAFGNRQQTIEYATAVNMSGASLSDPVLPAVATAYNDRLTEYAYDKLNRQIKVSRQTVFIQGSGFSSALKEVLRSTYDNNGNITAQKANGQITATEYDALGRITRVTEPHRFAASTITLDPFKSTVMVAPVTDYTLDAFGNAVKVVRSAGDAINGAAVTIQQSFDHIGNLLEISNGLSGAQSAATRYEYDVGGRVIREYQFATASPGTRLTENRYYYDLTGRQLASTAVVTDAGGVKHQSGQSVDYNAFGDISKEYRVWGSATVTRLSDLSRSVQRSFSYDTMGRVSSSQGQDGETLYYYDLLGHVTRQEKQGNQATAADNRITEIVYDLLGRAQVQRLPSHTGIAGSLGTTTGMLYPKLSQTFDRWGNVITRTDAAGNATSYVYNHDSRILRETLPTTTVYREDGTSYTPALTHEIQYNDLGLAVQEVDKADGTTLRSRSNAYDAVGQLTSTTDANGVRMEYMYDAMGNQVATRNELGTVYVDTYDARGLQIERAILRRLNGGVYNSYNTPDPIKVVLNTFEYDAIGRRTTEWSYVNTNADGSTSLGVRYSKRYSYNELGSITRTVNESGIAVDYKYDAHGNKIEERNALGHTQRWTYSEANYIFGRLTGSLDIGSAQTTYSYDEFGQLTLEDLVGSWDKTYSYHENGLLKTVTQRIDQNSSYGPNSTSISTNYDYDIRGNRVREIHSGNQVITQAYTNQGGTISVNTFNYSASFTQLMAYDARNRLSQVQTLANGTALRFDTGPYAIGQVVDLSYKYDEFGNRRNISASYKRPDDSTARSSSIWYAYDKEGRVLIEDGTVTAGSGMSIVANKGVRLTYDAAGQRRSEERLFTGMFAVPLPEEQGGGAVYYSGRYLTSYTYNDLGLMQNQLAEEFRSETGSSNYYHGSYGFYGSTTTAYRYDLRGFKLTEDKGREYITSVYLADGRLSSQTVSEQDGSLESVTSYNDYDAAGNLRGYTYTQYDNTGSYQYRNTYTYNYVINNGEYKNHRISVSSDLSGYKTGETDIDFNVFGNVAHTTVNNGRSGSTILYTNDYMVYNNDGQIIYNTETRTNGSPKHESHFYVNGNTVAKLSNGGQSSFTPFQANRKGMEQGSTPGQYVVQGGETLENISQVVYGNPRYWYLIADANGLGYSASDPLPPEEAGRPLRIPNVVSNKYNDSDTFKPYNPAEIIGDLTPSPVAPPPPKEGKSNAFASIIMIVVAIVVTIYTAGAAASLMGAATGATATGAWAAGTALLSGAGGLSWAGAAAAFIGGYAGSAASQLAGKAMGVVESFDPRQAISGGLSSVFSMGVGAALKSTSDAAGLIKTAADGTKKLTTAGSFVQGATGYAGSYAANKIAGLEAHFDWDDIAIASLSAGVSAWAGGEGSILEGADLGMGTFGEQLVGSFTSKAVGATVNRLFGNGKQNWGQVAVDAFGNALANSIVAAGVKTDIQNTKEQQRMNALAPVTNEAARARYEALRAEADKLDPAAREAFLRKQQIILFDGTGNRAADSFEDEGTGTNIEALREMYRELYKGANLDFDQHHVYVPGEGTSTWREVWSSFINGRSAASGLSFAETMADAFSGPATGLRVDERTAYAMAQLEDNLAELKMQAGDVELVVAGFSRGAATAINFLNTLADDAGGRFQNTRISALLFDPVASTGPIATNNVNPGLDLEVPDNKQLANLRIVSMVSDTEHRASFSVTRLFREGEGTQTTENGLWRRTSSDGRLTEIQGLGAHSDVGGGYRDNDNLAKLNFVRSLNELAGMQEGRMPMLSLSTMDTLKMPGATYDDKTTVKTLTGMQLNKNGGVDYKVHDSSAGFPAGILPVEGVIRIFKTMFNGVTGNALRTNYWQPN